MKVFLSFHHLQIPAIAILLAIAQTMESLGGMVIFQGHITERVEGTLLDLSLSLQSWVWIIPGNSLGFSDWAMWHIGV